MSPVTCTRSHRSCRSIARTIISARDEPRFEVTVENAGSTTVRVPFSPDLADLQPENPAKRFAYSKLQITLWIAARKQWFTNSGGSGSREAHHVSISAQENRSSAEETVGEVKSSEEEGGLEPAEFGESDSSHLQGKACPRPG